MSENGEEKKSKIIIDDDWKSQAQAEKEDLADKIEGHDAPANAAAEAAAPQDQQGHGEIPPASFTVLVSTLATQAMLALGGMEDPRTKKRIVDLALAKHHIDMLGVLEEKTAGNISDQEKKLLDQAIYEIRMHYVQMAQRVGGA